MTPFLKLVADDLRQKMNNDLSKVVVVFPNKRASLFMNEYLVPQQADGMAEPIWAPRYMTISDFFRSLSPFAVVETIEAICRLYRHYVALTGSKENARLLLRMGRKTFGRF